MPLQQSSDPPPERSGPRGVSRSGAFTLLELLVSLAVIALLLCMLLPALSGLASSSRCAACMSNLRQMCIAATAYVSLYDVYPPAIRYDSINGVGTTIAWDFAQTAAGSVSPGPLWEFTDNPGRVMQCPEFHGSSTFGADPYTGYNYNTTFIGAEQSFPNSGWTGIRWGLRPSQIRRSESGALFGDGGWAGGANKFMRAPENSIEGSLQTVYAGGQAFRHARRTSIGFLDGHVATAERQYRGIFATEELLADVMGYPHNGFLSEDDSAYDPR
jgi:prepilin-type N-terminal cleavage/methylation domain-containing protein/prepilin-type processing-associated H-X9-DG protein